MLGGWLRVRVCGGECRVCVRSIVESEGVCVGRVVERRERSMVLVFCILKVMKN